MAETGVVRLVDGTDSEAELSEPWDSGLDEVGSVSVLAGPLDTSVWDDDDGRAPESGVGGADPLHDQSPEDGREPRIKRERKSVN